MHFLMKNATSNSNNSPQSLHKSVGVFLSIKMVVPQSESLPPYAWEADLSGCSPLIPPLTTSKTQPIAGPLLDVHLKYLRNRISRNESSVWILFGELSSIKGRHPGGRVDTGVWNLGFSRWKRGGLVLKPKHRFNTRIDPWCQKGHWHSYATFSGE